MQIEVRKVSNGYLIVTKSLEPGYSQFASIPIQSLATKEYVATTLDSAMDKLRELLK